MGTDWLARNLDVLGRKAPKLAARLKLPVDSDHVVATPDGALHYRHHLSTVALALDPAATRGALPPGPGPLFILGAGLGELAGAWLDQQHGPVVAWERDPLLLRLMLSRRDWTGALSSGQLRLGLGVDLLELTLPRESGAALAPHPFLATQVYRNERLLLDAPEGGPLAFIAEGGLFVSDVSDALRAEGYRVYTLDVRRLAREESTQAVRRARPRVLVTINHVTGLSSFAEAEGVKLVEWEIDPSLTRLVPAKGSTRNTRVFTWRKAAVAEYAAAGFGTVEHLPLAADPEHRRPPDPAELEPYRAPVSFVGASMADRVPGLRQAFITRWQEDRRGTAEEGGKVLDEVLQEQARDFSSYRVPELLAARAPGWQVPAGTVEPERLAGELAAAQRRLLYATALEPLGIHVWGDAGWKRARALTRYRGPAGHGQEINRIYAASTINVDMGRLYQLDIVTMRVFDVLACGGFVLAERCEDLAELFKVGEEVEAWSTLDELKDKVKHYLAHPDQARAIAGRGRAAVLERHTIRQRVRHMLGM